MVEFGANCFDFSCFAIGVGNNFALRGIHHIAHGFIVRYETQKNSHYLCSNLTKMAVGTMTCALSCSVR